ncbi:MAG: GNAT family N-acetyltransferase [Alphaproteobacteria bacterium]|nr:GNAT family N-acetyltransferase [Alphaproteobacteria bacterium]
MQTEIRPATDKDLKDLDAFIEEHRYSKSADYFIRQYEEQTSEGNRVLLIARGEGQLLGYCVLNWQPKYAFFKAHDIPEIQDLNVHKDFRKQGIATFMIQDCEKRAIEKGLKTMGISFGLTPSYGAAQKLYFKLGYRPDGHGATYDRKVVVHGDIRPIDDDLCLMLIKDLQTP